jgi:hypothetical protein
MLSAIAQFQPAVVALCSHSDQVGGRRRGGHEGHLPGKESISLHRPGRRRGRRPGQALETDECMRPRRSPTTMAQRKRVQLYSSCAIVCSAHDFNLLLQIRYSAHKPFASFTNAILALLTQLPCVLSFRNIVGGRRRGGRRGHEGPQLVVMPMSLPP